MVLRESTTRTAHRRCMTHPRAYNRRRDSDPLQPKEMTMKSEKLTRRQMFGASVLGLPAIPVVVETAFAQAKPAAAALPVLGPNEPAAKALGYVEDTKKVDKKANPNHKPRIGNSKGPLRTAHFAERALW